MRHACLRGAQCPLPHHSRCRRPVPQMRQLATLPSDHACTSTPCARIIGSSSSACHASAAASNTSTRGHPRLQASRRPDTEHARSASCMLQTPNAFKRAVRAEQLPEHPWPPSSTQASLIALPQRLHLLQAQGSAEAADSTRPRNRARWKCLMHAAAAQCSGARCQPNPLTPPPEALRARHRRWLFLPLRLSTTICRRKWIPVRCRVHGCAADAVSMPKTGALRHAWTSQSVQQRRRRWMANVTHHRATQTLAVR